MLRIWHQLSLLKKVTTNQWTMGSPWLLSNQFQIMITPIDRPLKSFLVECMNWRDRPPGGRIPLDESLPNHPIDNLLLEKLRRCSLWQVMHPLTFLSYLASVTYSSTKQLSRSSPSMSARHSQTHPVKEMVTFLNFITIINPLTRRIPVTWKS